MNHRLNRKTVTIVAMSLAVVGAAIAQDGNVNVTIRHAPYDVPNVSSKSERATVRCQYCGSKVKYDRKYRWDAVKHEWILTTKPEDVPSACRKCQQKESEKEKLDRRENELDRKIEVEKTKSRVSSKEKKLKRLRNANR